MNLVKCPFCKHAFSPTPGQVIKCPGCLKTLKRATGGSSDGKAAARREIAGMREALDKKSSGNPLVSFLMTAAVVGAIGAGGFYWFTRPKADATDKPAVIAEVKKAPQVVAPKPTPIAPKVDPDEDPLKQFQPKVKPTPPKVKVVEPDPKDDEPKEPPKKVVRVVPGVEPETLVNAMNKGKGYLVATANAWTSSTDHPIGNAALGAVALLECLTPENHPAIQAAARTVRSRALAANQTYELATGILLLDRLGVAADRPLILFMAARLVAGQEAAGGWNYFCPQLNELEAAQLITLLNQNRMIPAGAVAAIKADPQAANKVEPLDPMPPKVLPKTKVPNQKPKTAVVAIPAAGVFEKLKKVPSLVNQGRTKDQLVLGDQADSQADNSNTQFAILGLFAARRHGMATDRALLLADLRFRATQFEDAWGYGNRDPSASMICVGLLGLAVGNAVQHPDGAGFAQAIETDSNIQRAFAKLAAYIEEPAPTVAEIKGPGDFYFYWCVERVGMLYNRQEIGGKDWYGWGAQRILKKQEANGSWHSTEYSHSTPFHDTCFALLFLSRANLLQEVSHLLSLQKPLGKR